MFNTLLGISPYLAYFYDYYNWYLTIPAVATIIYTIKSIIQYLAGKDKNLNLPQLTVLVWYSLLIATPYLMPNSTENIRIVLESTIPLSLISSYLLAKLYNWLKRKIGEETRLDRLLPKLIVAVLVFSLITFSGIRNDINMVTTYTEKVREIHLSAYDAMLWLNNQQKCSVISIVLPHFKYLEALTKCKFVGDYYLNASALEEPQVNITHIAVAKYFKHLYTYTNATFLEKAYENKYVIIFRYRVSP